ncbi:MAG: DUF2029 domain-containing protein [Candidatus Sabulitectum sp.]|nr:DUF2029 domain-containing protein [Candidatus Sabulitectum sp.]
MQADSIKRHIAATKGKKVLPIITVLFFIAGFLYSRSYTPAWPGDFTAYLGAGYALAEGVNPYDDEVVSRCLSQNGLKDVENLPYLYSPVFALPFATAQYTGPIWVRRIWFTCLHASFWLGFYLLLRKKLQKISITIMLTLGTLLLFVGPYRAAARWGQVTVLLFFLVSLMMYRQRNSALSGSVISLVPLIKPALAVPLLFLRGKAWLFLALSTITLILITVGMTGFEPWRQYTTALNIVSSEWDLSIPGNRSLTGNVHRIVGTYSKSYIMEVSEHREKRIERAEKVRSLSILISVLLMLLILAAILRAIGQSKWRSFYLSAHFVPLLCWISLLISPLAYDHYGLFLLPLLIDTFFIPNKKLCITAGIAFACWAFIPNGNAFVTNNTLLLLIEAIRPALLAWVAILYTRVTLAVLLPENCNSNNITCH